MKRRMNRYRKLVSQLAGGLLAVGLLASGCEVTPPPVEQDAGRLMDAGEDTSDVPKVEFEWHEKEEIYKMSPEDMGPPTESTNAVADDPRAVQMGHFLFFDERLSANGEVSCATCHQPDHGFADPDPVSSTELGTTGRHSPTLLNVAYKLWYFWDGRTDSLWSQATQPMEAFNEMGYTRLQLAHLVAQDDELRQAYEDIFGALPDLSDTSRFPEKGRPVPGEPSHEFHQAWESMTEADQKTINRIFTNVAKTISAYELQLVSLDSPFDTFVEGLREEDEAKQQAISPSAQRGLKLFLNEAQCSACHHNELLSAHTFHNLGLAKADWIDEPDLGRYSGVEALINDPFNALGEYSDDRSGGAAVRTSGARQTDEQKGQFRVAMLRNIALTPPYMHAGQFETLEDVVSFYSELDQEPSVGTRDREFNVIGLSDDKIADLVAFMESLTGKGVPEKYTEPPASPLP